MNAQPSMKSTKPRPASSCNSKRLLSKLRRNLFKATLFAGFALATPAFSIADQGIESSSLSKAPANADFYAGFYNGDQQWQAFVDGPVVRSLLELPVVQENWSIFQELWDDTQSDLAQARFVWDSPVLQDILRFTGELASKDLFIFGDENITPWIVALNKISDDIVESNADDEFNEAKALQLLEKLGQQIGNAQVPHVVVGGGFSSDYEAMNRVDQVELMLGVLQQASPEAARFARMIKRIDDDRGSRLVLELKGDMIPWDKLPTNERFTPRVKAKAQELLRERTCCITFGMLDGYFVLALGPDQKTISSWNDGESLVSNPLLKPALENSSKGLIQLGYSSDALAKAQYENSFGNILSEFVNAFTTTLEAENDLDESQQQWLSELKTEGNRLNAELMKLLPDFKGALQYAWRTENGAEMWTHSRTRDPLMDGSSPLTLTNRLGDDPIVGVVTRAQKRPEYFEFLKDLVKTSVALAKKAESLGFPGSEESMEKLRNANQTVDLIQPSLERLSDIYETKLFPSLNGEGGLVITSGNLVTRQWHNEMPESNEPLPIYDVGMVQRLDDPQLFQEGLEEFRDVINDLIKIAREQSEEELPDSFELPAPQVVETAVGRKHIYALPEELGLFKGLKPQAIYTKDVWVLAYSDNHAEKLAQSTEGKQLNSLIEPNSNLGNASFVDIGRILSVLSPWLRYAAEQNVEDFDENLIDTRESLKADFAITTNDLFSLWSVLLKAGRFESISSIGPEGETITRTIYTQSE